MKRKLTTHPAVIAVWAALIAVAALVPTTPILGTAATFNLSYVLDTLAGIFFGPWAGAICAALGGFIGQMLVPPVFGPISFILPTISALGAGLAMQRRWIWPLVVILALGLAWYIFPLGREAWFTPSLYLLGILAIAVGWVWGGDWLRSEDRAKTFAGMFVAAMTGAIVRYSLGNLFVLIMFALPKEIWLAALYIAPIERLAFPLGSAIIGVPLMAGLSRIGIVVGPKRYE